MTSSRYPAVLTIAGSDSSGGAGIQADIKSICANGAYAASVITATTAQNTQGVTEIYPIPVAHIIKQLEAVLDDITIDVIKIGMLHSTEVVEALTHTLGKYHVDHIVLDPVMIATSGERLINEDAISALKRLMQMTTLITPNIPEAEALLEKKISRNNLKESARELALRYQTSVLLKGGHLKEEKTLTDTLYNYHKETFTLIEHPFIATPNTHGTGCTLASAIASHLAHGKSLEDATRLGCGYLHKAIEAGKEKTLGKGDGPVHHFFTLHPPL